MTVSTEDIRRLRRMVNEMTDTSYSNEDLISYIGSYPLIDANGKDYTDENWVAKYDLHSAAAEIWEEKAATFQTKHDFSADGASFSSNQMYENAMDQARYHAARSTAKNKVVIKSPSSLATNIDSQLGLIANIDPYDEDDPYFLWSNI